MAKKREFNIDIIDDKFTNQVGISSDLSSEKSNKMVENATIAAVTTTTSFLLFTKFSASSLASVAILAPILIALLLYALDLPTPYLPLIKPKSKIGRRLGRMGRAIRKWLKGLKTKFINRLKGTGIYKWLNKNLKKLKNGLKNLGTGLSRLKIWMQGSKLGRLYYKMRYYTTMPKLLYKLQKKRLIDNLLRVRDRLRLNRINAANSLLKKIRSSKWYKRLSNSKLSNWVKRLRKTWFAKRVTKMWRTFNKRLPKTMSKLAKAPRHILKGVAKIIGPVLTFFSSVRDINRGMDPGQAIAVNYIEFGITSLLALGLAAGAVALGIIGTVTIGAAIAIAIVAVLLYDPLVRFISGIIGAISGKGYKESQMTGEEFSIMLYDEMKGLAYKDTQSHTFFGLFGAGPTQDGDPVARGIVKLVESLGKLAKWFSKDSRAERKLKKEIEKEIKADEKIDKLNNSRFSKMLYNLLTSKLFFIYISAPSLSGEDGVESQIADQMISEDLKSLQYESTHNRKSAPYARVNATWPMWDMKNLLAIAINNSSKNHEDSVNNVHGEYQRESIRLDGVIRQLINSISRARERERAAVARI